MRRPIAPEISTSRRGLFLFLLTVTTVAPTPTREAPRAVTPPRTSPTTPTTVVASAPSTVPSTTVAPATLAPTATASGVDPSPPLLWSARHDGGTTREWSSDGGGGMYNSGANQAVVSSEQGHSGTRSLRAKIWTPGSPNSGVRAFRWKEARANRDAYYSVWIYLPQPLNPGGRFLNLFQFKSRTADGRRVDPVWAFYGTSDGQGGAYLRAGWGWGGTPLAGPRSTDGVSGTWFEPMEQVSLPVGRWIHLEAFLHQSNEFDGRVQFWQDGVQLFDLNNIRTSFKNCRYNRWCASNEWSVNLYSDKFSPNPATLYIDDGAIARSYIP